MSSGSPSIQPAKPGRGQQVVELHGQLGAVLGREERLQIDRADAFERRRLDLPDQAGQVEVLPLAPGRVEQLARAEYARGCGSDRHRCPPGPAGREAAATMRSRSRSSSARDLAAAEHRTNAARTTAGRHSSRACRSPLSAASRNRAMRSPSWPHSASPSRQRLAVCAASSSGVISFRPASALVDPGTKVAGPQFGKRQQQVAQVSLGVDGDGRNAVDGGFFQQRQAQARLAAAGHADADGVRGQVLGVVEDQVLSGLALGQVVFAAEVEKRRVFRSLPSPAWAPLRCWTMDPQVYPGVRRSKALCQESAPEHETSDRRDSCWRTMEGRHRRQLGLVTVRRYSLPTRSLGVHGRSFVRAAFEPKLDR